MKSSRFDQLLDELPRIAEVINAFESIEIQKEVFEALMQVYLYDAQPKAAATQQVRHPAGRGSAAAVELPDAGSAIDDDFDESGDGSVHVDLASESADARDDFDSGISDGDSIHSFIQG